MSAPRRGKDIVINANDGDDVADDWVVIAQAQRILSARHGITFDEGARLLTRKARRVDRSVGDIARSIVDAAGRNVIIGETAISP